MTPQALSLFGNQNIKYVVIIVALSGVVYYVFTLERRINSLERLASMEVPEYNSRSEVTETEKSVVDSDEEKWMDDEFINLNDSEGFTKCLELDLEGNAAVEELNSEQGLEELLGAELEQGVELERETELEQGVELELGCCKAILKSGKKKGERCHKTNVIGGEYCKFHLK